MLQRWFQKLRPSRRWFQYRLRTLFVLTTLLCIWLSYNAWRYQREQMVVKGIMAADPEAKVVWVAPAWLRWLDKKSVPAIFRRVESVAIDVKETPEPVSRLQLQKLSSLRSVTLVLESVDGWDDTKAEEKDARLEKAIGALLPGVKLEQLHGISYNLYGLVGEYLANHTDAAAANVRNMFRNPERPAPRYSNNPGPLNYRLSGMNAGSGDEDNIAKVLTCRHKDIAVLAAKDLWVGHSREHAVEVIVFASKLNADTDEAKELKSLIKTEFATKRIIAELQKPADENTAWWAWLAALRPRPTMVPVLIQLAQQKAALCEVVYALRRSKDPRSLPVLMEVLTKSDNDPAPWIAADAIGEIGDATLEPQLIEALHSKSYMIRCCVSRALAQIGTERCLPELRKLAANAKTGAQAAHFPNESEAAYFANEAIKLIEQRLK